MITHAELHNVGVPITLNPVEFPKSVSFVTRGVLVTASLMTTMLSLSSRKTTKLDKRVPWSSLG